MKGLYSWSEVENSATDHSAGFSQIGYANTTTDLAGFSGFTHDSLQLVNLPVATITGLLEQL